MECEVCRTPVGPFSGGVCSQCESRRKDEEIARLRNYAEQRQEWNRTLSHEIGKLRGRIEAALAETDKQVPGMEMLTRHNAICRVLRL